MHWMLQPACWPQIASVMADVERQKLAVARRLKAARSALDLTQKELCSLIEMPLPSLRDYELGNRIPGGDAIAGLVRAGISANWLLTGEGVMLLRNAPPDRTCSSADAEGGSGEALPKGEGAAGEAHGAARQFLDPTQDERRQMFLVMLRAAEHRLSAPMTHEVAERILDLVTAWRPFAENDHALVTRIEALRTAARFYLAIVD